MPFEELVALASAGQTRLLRANTLRIGDQDEHRYVSLGHDAIAKIAADWDEEISRGAQVRKLFAFLAGIGAVAVVMFALAAYGFWQAKEARDQRRVAVENRKVAEAAEKRARRQLYVSDMNLAHAAGNMAGSIAPSSSSPTTSLNLVGRMRVASSGITCGGSAMATCSLCRVIRIRRLSAAFAPNGTRVASGGKDGVVKDGTPRSTVDPVSRRHSDAVWGLAYSPDGRRFATASVDRSIRVWDSETNALLRPSTNIRPPPGASLTARRVGIWHQAIKTVRSSCGTPPPRNSCTS